MYFKTDHRKLIDTNLFYDKKIINITFQVSKKFNLRKQKVISFKSMP